MHGKEGEGEAETVADAPGLGDDAGSALWVSEAVVDVRFCEPGEDEFVEERGGGLEGLCGGVSERARTGKWERDVPAMSMSTPEIHQRGRNVR